MIGLAAFLMMTSLSVLVLDETCHMCSVQSVDREPLIFHLDSGSRRHDNTELPDEFFEVTVDDVRKRFAQLKSER